MALCLLTGDFGRPPFRHRAMPESHEPEGRDSELRDPEFSAGGAPPEGVSSRKFLGIPAWATAVGFAVLAALMYLLMLML